MPFHQRSLTGHREQRIGIGRSPPDSKAVISWNLTENRVKYESFVNCGQ